MNETHGTEQTVARFRAVERPESPFGSSVATRYQRRMSDQPRWE